ncbi:hypothetical protein GCM10010341_72870 [Streptomyces noursei]|nr:hypothetical protein GCM10010341_72870 [Streptomyces noursei]
MGDNWRSTSTPYITPRAAGDTDAWTAETANRGGQQLVEVVAIVPPEAVARALALQPGTEAVVRRRVMLEDGAPVEITDSYYPMALAAGTQLAEHRKIRGGAPTLLASLGLHTRHVSEEVEARGATPQEAELLNLEPGTPVLTLLRTTMAADDQPVEASLMVMKGPRRLRYEMEVE